MRLYLDTNALVDLLKGEKNFDSSLLDILSDEANLLYTCPVAVHELIFQIQTGGVSFGKKCKDIDVVQRILDYPIEITNITVKHLREEQRLPFIAAHRDPADRLIVAQAISDRAYLVSCDTVFPEFVKYGLNLYSYKRRR